MIRDALKRACADLFVVITLTEHIKELTKELLQFLLFQRDFGKLEMKVISSKDNSEFFKTSNGCSRNQNWDPSQCEFHDLKES